LLDICSPERTFCSSVTELTIKYAGRQFIIPFDALLFLGFILLASKNQASIMLFLFSSDQDKMMLQPAERLVAFAILHQGYSSQLANPFVPLLINVSCKLVYSFETHFQVSLPSALTKAN